MAKTYGASLPAAWYREPALYELERRAIFSKHWLLITHKSRLAQVGEYFSTKLAGFPLFVMRDRAGNIGGFLNVCRHRAFPVIQQDSGIAKIIACKYHGWSYGLNGNLAKAPRFDTISDFDKSQYGLFKLHTHVDRLGFVYVNLDSSSQPVPWEEQFGGLDEHERFNKFDMDNYVFDHDWKMDGSFNWKALMENYNECYHCPVAHPGFAAFLKPEGIFPKEFKKSYIEYFVEGSMKDEVNIPPAAPTYLYPNSTLTVAGPFFYMMATVPTSPTTSIMQYQIFRNKTVSDAEFKEASEFFKQVEREDKVLGNGSQSNLNTDTFVAGPLHPGMEDAVYHFHGLLRESLHKHRKLEERTGKELWPARRVAQDDHQLSEDILFCQKLCDKSLSTDPAINDKLLW